MKLEEIKAWIKGSRCIDSNCQTDSSGNEDEERIYEKDGRLYKVYFSNGYHSQHFNGEHYVRKEYTDPEPVVAKHELVYHTTYEAAKEPQSFEASKFKPGNLADLLEDVTIHHEPLVPSMPETTQLYRKGLRGMVVDIRGDSIEIEFGLEGRLQVPPSMLKITHASPKTVFAMAENFNQIRAWAGRQAGIVFRSIKVPMTDSAEKMTAMGVRVTTQPFVTLEEAREQTERVLRASEH